MLARTKAHERSVAGRRRMLAKRKTSAGATGKEAYVENLILFAILISAVVPACAGIFKCESPAGTVYSEKPCAGNSTELHLRVPPPAIDRAPHNNIMQELKDDNSERAKRDKVRQKAAEDKMAQARKQRCAQARERLNLYRQPVPIYSKDAKGERVYVDDNTRASIIRNAAEIAEANCD